jgi:hypothetical protein
MKKIILTSLCTLGAAGVVLAQGTINYGSWLGYTMETNTTVVSPLYTGTVTGGTIGKVVGSTGSDNFYYEVLFNAASTPSPSSLAALSGWQDTGLGGVNNTTAGSILALNQSTDATGLGTIPTGSDEFLLVGWSADLGATWSTVEAALNNSATLAADAANGTLLFGYTAASGNITVGSANPGTKFQGTGLIPTGITTLDVVPTPEPSTIALGVMGAASLLALRRKKA